MEEIAWYISILKDGESCAASDKEEKTAYKRDILQNSENQEFLQFWTPQDEEKLDEIKMWKFFRWARLTCKKIFVSLLENLLYKDVMQQFRSKVALNTGMLTREAP